MSSRNNKPPSLCRYARNNNDIFIRVSLLFGFRFSVRASNYLFDLLIHVRILRDFFASVWWDIVVKITCKNAFFFVTQRIVVAFFEHTAMVGANKGRAEENEERKKKKGFLSAENRENRGQVFRLYTHIIVLFIFIIWIHETFGQLPDYAIYAASFSDSFLFFSFLLFT